MPKKRTDRNVKQGLLGCLPVVLVRLQLRRTLDYGQPNNSFFNGLRTKQMEGAAGSDVHIISCLGSTKNILSEDAVLQP
ncbi:unnamed protein product [Soboliphyme baturini]|uniref:Ovule protein n=1 Tax=Soboliphyme baturini TaxID=241478 RepID=A0A183IW54_9BILA|nr:unnamed protein product [Soboliphyme baturini]